MSAPGGHTSNEQRFNISLRVDSGIFEKQFRFCVQVNKFCTFSALRK